MPLPQLVLVYEPEDACRTRLAAQGFPERHALEISSYLAQSTDLALEFERSRRPVADAAYASFRQLLTTPGPVLASADPWSKRWSGR